MAKKLTWRQYLVWHYWLLLQKNEPSRSDYYIMQLNRDVCAIATGKYQHDLNFFKIPMVHIFDDPEEQEKEDRVKKVDNTPADKVDIHAPPPRLSKEQLKYYSSYMLQHSMMRKLGGSVIKTGETQNGDRH